MALQDFIQSLQNEDIVYSNTPAQPSIRVNQQENQERIIKVIPPQAQSETSQTKVIKLKLKTVPKFNTQPTEQIYVQPVVNTNQQVINDRSVQTTPPSQVSQSVGNQPVNNPVQVNTQPVHHTQSIIQTQSTVQDKVEITDDDVFNSTGTELSKKELWMEYYTKAKNSRKSNPIADRMKVGRFTITPDNKVLLLPDYDVVGKDPDDILKDKWF